MKRTQPDRELRARKESRSVERANVLSAVKRLLSSTEGKQVKDQGLRGSPGSQVLRGTRSASPVGTFCIYSFDGRLLSEYDIYGTCLRDYIYMGSRLIAEYRPQEGKYYYYTSDQINSTRIVTNDSGAVVYSTAYDPFGGIQKTWTSTYDPALKFSGKERDAESGLDYFGARYYDKATRRTGISDPCIFRESSEC